MHNIIILPACMNNHTDQRHLVLYMQVSYNTSAFYTQEAPSVGSSSTTEEAISDSLPVRRNRVLESDDDEVDDWEKHGTSTDSVAVRMPKKIQKIDKCYDDTVPLLNPFPLPKHYSAEVEVALKAKQMSSIARKQFVGSVATAMLFNKRYPTSADCQNVGSTVIAQYPFLRSPAGSPAVSAINACMERLCTCTDSTKNTTEYHIKMENLLKDDTYQEKRKIHKSKLKERSTKL